MNDHISKLLFFFKSYAEQLYKKKLILELDIKNINIDFISKS